MRFLTVFDKLKCAAAMVRAGGAVAAFILAVSSVYIFLNTDSIFSAPNHPLHSLRSAVSGRVAQEVAKQVPALHARHETRLSSRFRRSQRRVRAPLLRKAKECRAPEPRGGGRWSCSAAPCRRGTTRP